MEIGYWICTNGEGGKNEWILSYVNQNPLIKVMFGISVAVLLVWFMINTRSDSNCCDCGKRSLRSIPPNILLLFTGKPFILWMPWKFAVRAEIAFYDLVGRIAVIGCVPVMTAPVWLSAPMVFAVTIAAAAIFWWFGLLLPVAAALNVRPSLQCKMVISASGILRDERGILVEYYTHKAGAHLTLWDICSRHKVHLLEIQIR